MELRFKVQGLGLGFGVEGLGLGFRVSGHDGGDGLFRLHTSKVRHAQGIRGFCIFGGGMSRRFFV